MKYKLSCNIRGSLNKLTIGRTVQATPELVDWYARHLTWMYGVSAEGRPGYFKGDKEIGISDLSKVYVWSRAKISGELPKGTVSHYGAEEGESSKSGKRKKFVYVKFVFKTELGPIEYGTYVSENRVTLIKKRKKK